MPSGSAPWHPPTPTSDCGSLCAALACLRDMSATGKFLLCPTISNQHFDSIRFDLAIHHLVELCFLACCPGRSLRMWSWLTSLGGQEDGDVSGFSVVPGLAQFRRRVFFLHISISDFFL